MKKTLILLLGIIVAAICISCSPEPVYQCWCTTNYGGIRQKPAEDCDDLKRDELHCNLVLVELEL